MSHYRKIDTRIWNDEKFNSLSHHAKLAFVFVLTHPNMTSLGAMRGTIAGLSDELEVLPKAFQEPFDKGLLKADDKAKIIYAPNFLKYNKPENPNVVKAWGKAFEMLPEGETKHEIYYKVKCCIKDYGKGFQEVFQKVFGKEYPKTVSSEQ